MLAFRVHDKNEPARFLVDLSELLAPGAPAIYAYHVDQRGAPVLVLCTALAACDPGARVLALGRWAALVDGFAEGFFAGDDFVGDLAASS